MTQDIIARVRVRAYDEKTRTDQVDVFLPKIRDPLLDAEVDHFEGQTGIKLPELIRRIYCEIGDGGFGPGYGFLPMLQPESKYDDSVLNLYSVVRDSTVEEPNWRWPKAIIPLVDFGCAIRACVDCESELVVVDDPNISDSGGVQEFLDQQSSLEDWLGRWCDGESLWDRIHRMTPPTRRCTNRLAVCHHSCIRENTARYWSQVS